jgi:hypothetical protein
MLLACFGCADKVLSNAQIARYGVTCVSQECSRSNCT